MTSPIGIAALALAGLYLATTLAFQIPPLSRRFPLLDRLGVLPRWKFFTQGKGAHDFGIAVRDRRHDGTMGAWQPVAIAAPRRLWNTLWFPQRYRAAVYWLAIDTLVRRVAAAREAGPETSRAYALLLARCRAEPRHADSDARQFAVVRIAAARSEQLFVSDVHPF